MAKQKISVRYYHVEVPNIVSVVITWLHPDDISKVNITQVPHIRESLVIDEFEFLLHRNILLEAGYVPVKTENYMIAPRWEAPKMVDTYTYTVPKHWPITMQKLIDTSKSKRVAKIKKSLKTNK